MVHYSLIPLKHLVPKNDWVNDIVTSNFAANRRSNRTRYIIPRTGSRAFKLPWSGARRWCLFIKGDIASINDAKEQLRINSIIDSQFRNERIWIGANDMQREGHFQWSDGTRFAYTNWSSGEPNNKGARTPENCVEMLPRSYGRSWNDVACTYSQAFLCEIHY